jgi:DNA-binding transcriptional ArsR family regulator
MTGRDFRGHLISKYAVNQIVLRMKMAQPAVSKHLGALRKAGVVTMVKRGQHRMYRLDARGLKPVWNSKAREREQGGNHDKQQAE